MGPALLRWWWIPAGLLVAVLIASAVGVPWSLLVAGYVALNLLGTVLLLAEMREQERPEVWQRLTEVAFVLQLPVGVMVVVLGAG